MSEAQEYADPPRRYTVAVDFDGVIHSYESPWESAEVIPDPPVPGAIEWLTEIAEHYRVAIYTTRGETPEGQRAVRHWLHDNGLAWGMNAEVTDRKPPALIYLDDRGWQFRGHFPTSGEIAAFRPWKVVGGMEYLSPRYALEPVDSAAQAIVEARYSDEVSGPLWLTTGFTITRVFTAPGQFTDVDPFRIPRDGLYRIRRIG